MLDAAIETVVDTNDQPVAHSVRGAHDRWPSWLSRIAHAKLIRSMSRKGCSRDSAACEGFFGRLKTELFHLRNWKTTTIEQFIELVDSHIRWVRREAIKNSVAAAAPSGPREPPAYGIKPVQVRFLAEVAMLHARLGGLPPWQSLTSRRRVRSYSYCPAWSVAVPTLFPLVPVCHWRGMPAEADASAGQKYQAFQRQPGTYR